MSSRFFIVFVYIVRQIITRKVVYGVGQLLQPELLFKPRVQVLRRIRHNLELHSLALIVSPPQVVQYVVTQLHPQTGHL